MNSAIACNNNQILSYLVHGHADAIDETHLHLGKLVLLLAIHHCLFNESKSSIKSTVPEGEKPERT